MVNQIELSWNCADHFAPRAKQPLRRVASRPAHRAPVRPAVTPAPAPTGQIARRAAAPCGRASHLGEP